MRRVVITGMGVVAAPGNNPKEFFDTLLTARSGVRPIETIPPEWFERLKCKIGAAVTGFDPLAHFSEKEADQLDRFSQFAIVAARQAWQQSGLGDVSQLTDDQQRRLGVYVGTAYGGTMTLDDNYRRLYADKASRLSPLVIPRLMYNAAACQVSLYFQARGPVMAQVSACSSGSHAIGEAARVVAHGKADWMLAGGADAPLTYGVIRCWEAMRVLAPTGDDPEKACRPFSADRRGIVIGEGAGMFVLEEVEAAKKRGATILAEVVGYGANSDASHITQPSVDGPARAMQLALDDAGMSAGDIDYINAHGTATKVNDAVETKAIKQIFGDGAGTIPVSSTKAMHGHAMGASGAIEMAAVLEAMHRGVIPPTANYTTPDPDCDLDYVPNEPREKEIRVALSNSFAFGGLNVTLIVKKV